MASNVRIKLNPRGIEAVLTSDGVAADVRRRAESVLAKAQTDAPYDTGEYRDSLKVETDTTPGTRAAKRARARVIASARHSWIVEARTGNLRKALEAAGGRNE